jgi:hypothetical protein
MLTHEHRRRAAELLQESGLLRTILPELDVDDEPWQETLRLLEAVTQPTTAVVLAILLRSIYGENSAASSVEEIGRRWKLSNEEIDGVLLCLRGEAMIRSATTVPWPTLQRKLVAPRINEVMNYCEAVALIVDGRLEAIDYCSKKLALPPEAGVPPGPIYKRLLAEVRDAQLEGTVTTPKDALQLAKSLIGETDS